MSLKSGTLWIVATPLGNLGDLSPRAAQILQQATLILAEDTRRAGLLFSRCNLVPKKFMSFHEHNEAKKLLGVIETLQTGNDVALISDAGTPLMSDPGFLLVRACHEQNIAVSPIPGPSAPVTALSASGLPPIPFVFFGFLPRKPNEQQDLFKNYATLTATLVFFERKDRVKTTLATAFSILGEREMCLARELTKTHEEFLHCNLSQSNTLPDDLLGEITLIIGPPLQPNKHDEEAVLTFIKKESAHGGKPKEIARRVQLQISGWSSKDIYQLMQNQLYDKD